MTDAELACIDWMKSDEATCNPLHPLFRPVAEQAFAAGVAWAQKQAITPSEQAAAMVSRV